jgi:hypothetical protein
MCICRQWGCTESANGGCDCALGGGTLSKCLRSWVTCCKTTINTATNCFCDDFDFPCDTGSQKVTSCDLADVPCGSGETKAATCQD